MKRSVQFDNEGLKSEFLWKLRQQVDITGIYAKDYKNDFGVEESIAQDFFRCYLYYMETCAEESGSWDEVVLSIQDEVKYGLLVGCNSFSIHTAQLEFYKNLMFQRFDNESTLREFFEIYKFEECNPL